MAKSQSYIVTWNCTGFSSNSGCIGCESVYPQVIESRNESPNIPAYRNRPCPLDKRKIVTIEPRITSDEI